MRLAIEVLIAFALCLVAEWFSPIAGTIVTPLIGIALAARIENERTR